MKKRLKSIVVFAAIALMVIASVITSHAEMVTEGVNNNFLTRNQKTGEAIVAQMTFSKTPIAGKRP